MISVILTLVRADQGSLSAILVLLDKGQLPESEMVLEAPGSLILTI